jgi:hypothetical protein
MSSLALSPIAKTLSILLAVILLTTIIDLVRRRKLREEYSLLWVLIGVVIVFLAIWGELLRAITDLLGILTPVSTLFFFGVMFLVFLALHFSVILSSLTNRVIELAQELALLRNTIEERNPSPQDKE